MPSKVDQPVTQPRTSQQRATTPAGSLRKGLKEFTRQRLLDAALQNFRERGYRKDMGVRGAVAVMFNKRFIKSKKASTSNWANPALTPAQVVYAANDAYGALRVYKALGLG